MISKSTLNKEKRIKEKKKLQKEGESELKVKLGKICDRFGCGVKKSAHIATALAEYNKNIAAAPYYGFSEGLNEAFKNEAFELAFARHQNSTSR